MKAVKTLPDRNEIEETIAACGYAEVAAENDAATPQEDRGWFIRKVRENRQFRFEKDFIY